MEWGGPYNLNLEQKKSDETIRIVKLQGAIHLEYVIVIMVVKDPSLSSPAAPASASKDSTGKYKITNQI